MARRKFIRPPETRIGSNAPYLEGRDELDDQAAFSSLTRFFSRRRATRPRPNSAVPASARASGSGTVLQSLPRLQESPKFCFTEMKFCRPPPLGPSPLL